MTKSVAIVGAGVTGLTCGVVLVEGGWRVEIFAAERGRATTSAAAAAIWYPYDTGSDDAVIARSLSTYRDLIELAGEPQTGVSMIELRTFSRLGEIKIPPWAIPLDARRLSPHAGEIPDQFRDGFALNVPLLDTTIYLPYLEKRFIQAGGSVTESHPFANLCEVSLDFDLVINCSGIGAKTLVPDPDVEPHRGQVVVVPKLDLPYAIVCDDPPLMYAIPRAGDCVFGGTNEISDRREPDAETSARIVSECSRILKISEPAVLAERVGLRPFRQSGICLRLDRLSDGRPVIHNYGHGGAGFTLSWGCAREVAGLVSRAGLSLATGDFAS